MDVHFLPVTRSVSFGKLAVIDSLGPILRTINRRLVAKVARLWEKRGADRPISGEIGYAGLGAGPARSIAETGAGRPGATPRA